MSNSLYADVIVNGCWQKTWEQITSDREIAEKPDNATSEQQLTSDNIVGYNVEEGASESDLHETIIYDVDQDEIERQNQLRGIPFDTCMQEEDEPVIHDETVLLAGAGGRSATVRNLVRRIFRRTYVSRQVPTRARRPDEHEETSTSDSSEVFQPETAELRR